MPEMDLSQFRSGHVLMLCCFAFESHGVCVFHAMMSIDSTG